MTLFDAALLVEEVPVDAGGAGVSVLTVQAFR